MVLTMRMARQRFAAAPTAAVGPLHQRLCCSTAPACAVRLAAPQVWPRQQLSTRQQQQLLLQQQDRQRCWLPAGSCRVLVLATSGSSGGGGTLLTLPTILTLARVAAVPALVAAWYSTALWAGAACTALFVGASLTDWLDGYLARKLDASSSFGAFLDPVADKLMVATTMILLCTRPLPLGPMAGNTWLLPLLTCVVIGREITMSALREWAAALGPEAHLAVAVSWVGKWKTATQMASLTLLLLTHQGAAASAGGGCIAVPPALLQAAGSGGVPLLIVATVLTAWSLALYFASLWRFF